MVSLLQERKDISVMHLNTDWGYMAYIEKRRNEEGEFTYEVVRVPLGDGYKRKKPEPKIKEPRI